MLRPLNLPEMRRRDLAALHASELNAALFPSHKRDDELGDDEKSATQAYVAELTRVHRQELAAWLAVND